MIGQRWYLRPSPVAVVLVCGLVFATLSKSLKEEDGDSDTCLLQRRGVKKLPWIRRKPGTTWLMQGTKQFRFVSVNCPYVLYIPDPQINTVPYLVGPNGNVFPKYITQPYAEARLPTFKEIEDAFMMVKQMGGTVMRVFSFPVQNPKMHAVVKEPQSTYWMLKDQRNIESGLMWNPNATVIFDYVIQMAHKYQIYIIPAFINEWDAGGGLTAFCQAYGTSCPQKGCKPYQKTDTRINFFRNATLMNIFLDLITPIIAKYKDESAILGWETGNELGGSDCVMTNTLEFALWTRNVTARIKKIAPNGPLAIDGAMFHRDQWYEPNDNIDMLDLHLYPNYTQEQIVSTQWFPDLTRVAEKAQKAVMFGEVICHTDRCLEPLMNAFLSNRNAAGFLLWAMSHHIDSVALPGTASGGYFYHQETPPCALYGERYFNYHWPGFKENDFYNESKVMAIFQYGAARIAGKQATLGNYPSPLPIPPLPVPTAIQVLQNGTQPPAYYLFYTGSMGAEWYEVAVKATSDDDFAWLPQRFYAIGPNGQNWSFSNFTFGFPPAQIGLPKDLGTSPCVLMRAGNREQTSGNSSQYCLGSTTTSTTTTSGTTTSSQTTTSSTSSTSTSTTTSTPATTTTTTTTPHAGLKCCYSQSAVGSNICKHIYSCEKPGSFDSQHPTRCKANGGWMCP
eukprot:TRINITY_DN29140_c0_g3_i1.p1 TRINITY_DN29140_c0_g3~~TRINITY_DN29140_c0_g3_i1.p1  ORF type:complete len:691 (-),score=70.07 TRINITY_DN29140_c0_g3_i1:44-2071(-)